MAPLNVRGTVLASTLTAATLVAASELVFVAAGWSTAPWWAALTMPYAVAAAVLVVMWLAVLVHVAALAGLDTAAARRVRPAPAPPEPTDPAPDVSII